MPTSPTRGCPGLTPVLLIVVLALGACGGDSATAPNNAPVANAGLNRLASVGVVATLDGSGSSDADGDALTFTWSLTRPTGSSAALSSTTTAMPTFTPDVPGTYTVTLTVSDGSGTDDTTITITGVETYCDAIVDLFPTPVREATSPFADVDDGFLSVAFASGFQFMFYGQTYSSVYLNTNGGMTFGSGIPAFDVEAALVDVPTIAPFWGDMAAEAERDRAGQMYYEACPDRFLVYYQQLQDFDVIPWNNTATVTLLADGTITFDYGMVGSEDILAGIFDGSHTSDDYVSVQSDHYDYAASTGTILFDHYGAGPSHTGQELTDQTVTFHPAPGP